MSGRLGALLRKELRSIFASPIAYIVLTAYVSLSGVYFFQHLKKYNQILFVLHSQGIAEGGFDQGTVPVQFNTLNDLFIPASVDFSILLLAVIPLVTMRVFAEERAHGTDELLLTTPLRPWEISLAKYAATGLFVLLLLAVSAIYPSVVVVKSRLGVEHLLALYLGQLSYGLAVAAIGLACSSLTQSQIVAAVLGYAIPFILLDFAWITPVVSEGVGRFLQEVALQDRFEAFTRGVIELRHALYFGGILAVGFAISTASLDLARAR